MSMVKIDEHIHKKLKEISKARKKNYVIVHKYKDILAELVTTAHKKEVPVKKGEGK